MDRWSAWRCDTVHHVYITLDGSAGAVALLYKRPFLLQLRHFRHLLLSPFIQLFLLFFGRRKQTLKLGLGTLASIHQPCTLHPYQASLTAPITNL